MKIFEIPKGISSKIILEHKLGLWQNEMGIFNLRPQCNKSASKKQINFNVETVSKNTTVIETLCQTRQGQQIIDTYQETKLLNPSDRTFIVHKIIQIYLENNLKFNIEVCRNIALEIVEIFPSELLDTYFLQNSKRQPPKGKLWDRFQGRKRFLRKLSSNERKREKNEENDSSLKKPRSGEIEELCVELKYIKDCDEILTKWSKTQSFRTSVLQASTMSEIINDWPLYLSPEHSLKLVNMDFQYMFPAKKLLYNKWEKFVENFKILFKDRIKDHNSKQLLMKFIENQNAINLDNCNIYIFKLMSAILHPKTKVINGQYVKHSIEDSQNAFCVETENLNGSSFNLPQYAQEEPFLLVCGDEFNFKHFFVVFNKQKLEFGSFLETVDYTFKVMKLLNCNYSKECELIWSFVSQFLFEFEPSSKSPVLNTFLKDINYIPLQQKLFH